MEGNFNRKYSFGEEEDLFFSEQVSWMSNPLFCSDNNNTAPVFQGLVDADERFGNSVCLKNVEFETESGYSEGISVVSELSSPTRSISSNVSLSEDENEMIDEITESLRQASIEHGKCRKPAMNSTEIYPKQIISSKGTVRGVKNRVRDNILHFFSNSQDGKKHNSKNNEVHWEKNPDRGKVILYTTSLGFVRATQYECKYVKKIFHNLMVRFDERDLFVHPHFKDELQKKLGRDIITLPQVFIDGKLIGGAKDVELMIENGTMKEALESVEKVSHAQSCSTCGGYKFISCSKCSGSGKSRRTRFSREINSLKCSACTKGIISCPECNS